MIIEQQSVVEAPVEAVWARVITPEGINYEMRPWLTMSVPGAAHTMTIDTVPIGGERVASIVAPVLRAFFAHRHRRLQESFSAHKP